MNIYIICSEDRKVFGVGQTKRSFSKRHGDKDWTKFRNYVKARKEKVILVAWYENVNLLDTTIHNWLKKQPGIEKSAEWFSYNQDLETIDSIKQKIDNQFFIAKNIKKQPLKLRPYQKDFVAKAQADYLEFLLFAKCRAGKSVMVLAHVVDRKFKISLIVSRFTSPFDSWEKDPDDYDIFESIRVVSLYDSNWKEQIEFWLTQPDVQIVLTSTIQGLQSKLNCLQKVCKLDLLVFDECHIGSNGSQFKKLRKVFSDTPCLKVSGTAYEQVWDYSERNRFVYSYFDEQLDVLKGLYHRPKMKVYISKYKSKEYQNVFGNDPDAMKNIFTVESKKFKYESLVRDFILKHFDEKRRRFDDRLLSNSQHILICLPSVAACHLFAEMIEDFYVPFVVTGETGRKSDDIEKFIGENLNSKTITITCEANVLGVTQKKWDTVINCKGGKDAKFWTQFAFRGGSGDNDWIVIDFSAQLCLESLRKAYILAQHNNPQLSNYKFLDFVAIQEWQEKFEELTVDKINQIFAADVGDTVSLVSSLSMKIDSKKLNTVDFSTVLSPSKSSVVKSVLVNDNHANNKSNVSIESVSNSLNHNENKDKLKTIQAILECIPLVQFYELNDGKKVSTIDGVLSSKYYNQTTNDYENILQQCVSSDLIRAKDFSYTLNQSIVDIELSLKNSFSDTLDALCVTSSVHKPIPANLFDELTSFS